MWEKLKTAAQVVLIPIGQVHPSPYQTRVCTEDDALRNLAVSILHNGLLQPVSVRRIADKNYELIAGERRLRACKLCGMETIPAIIYNFEEQQTAAMSLLENWQRQQLNPFEQARAVQELLRLWQCTQEQAAARLGISQPTLANKLRLLALTDEQQKICVEGALTERHARAVLRLPEEVQRTAALKKAVQKQYSVQQLEQHIESLQHKKPKHHNAMMVRDVRIFINTINRAIRVMTQGGVDATATKREEKDFIEYVVRIPTVPAEQKRRQP